ncbi:hypothetical protein E9993_09545 [Labilibacter sediminis]|nr:hypothetical protein E9993_09545 [Labilibacter sediminis]
MKNSIILLIVLITSIGNLYPKPLKGKKSKDQPNIIVFLVDDMSYATLGYTGATKVKTPAIDKLINLGVFCEDGYVTHAVCAPSRAGLMTGRYQARFGYETLSDNDQHQRTIDHGVDAREIFLAEPLQKAGYKTAAMGKWHLGVNEKYHPNNRGYDYFFGWIGRCDYFNYNYDKKQLLRNDNLVDDINDGEYFTERMTDEAKAFIRSNANNPFFLYFSTYNVHKPHKVPDYYIPEGGDPYHGMVAAVDSAMDVIMHTLDDKGIRDNTLIFFLNDNGGVKGYPNTPFRGGKATYYEGGIRVPFSITWPAVLPEGKKYTNMVSSLDIFPTALAAAGVELPSDRQYDGVNLIPYLKGDKKEPPHQVLHWRAGWGHAVRYKNWKMVWLRDKKKTKAFAKENNLPKRQKTDLPNYNDRGTALYTEKPELYDLSKDISETNNVVDEYPEVVKTIMMQMDWMDKLPLEQQYFNK